MYIRACGLCVVGNFGQNKSFHIHTQTYTHTHARAQRIHKHNKIKSFIHFILLYEAFWNILYTTEHIELYTHLLVHTHTHTNHTWTQISICMCVIYRIEIESWNNANQVCWYIDLLITNGFNAIAKCIPQTQSSFTRGKKLPKLKVLVLATKLIVCNAFIEESWISLKCINFFLLFLTERISGFQHLMVLM